MLVSISNPAISTLSFAGVFLAILILLTRPFKITQWFPPYLTTELKGLAILMIVFSHIGYFLVNDSHFLYPLTIMAGVGVNLFLFLSGYGLTASQLAKKLSRWQFYKRRLAKLYVPFWLMMFTYLILDYFLLHITRTPLYAGKAILGIFTHANLYQDINSPLWYLTFILGYYLIYPWVFSRKRPWLSALVLYLAGYLLIKWNPAGLANVIYLYKVHILAFPLGVLAAGFITKFKNADIMEKWSRGWSAVPYYLIMIGFLYLFVYFNIHSDIGVPIMEQVMSTVAMLSLVGVFMMKKISFHLLYWFGLYSYEIYLFHWPLMYRYDFIYKYLKPGREWIGVLLYLGVFLILGWLMSRISNWILKGIWRKKTRATSFS